MEINKTLMAELEQGINNYFVVTREISSKISSMEEGNKEVHEKGVKGVDKKVLIELRKDTFYYQLYNVFLLKIISEIKVLFKLVSLVGETLDEEATEKIKQIIESDPETMIIESGEIVIIDESLKAIFENDLSSMSDDNINQLINSIDKL